MPGNSFGQLFRITSFGESHGRGVGVVIDGCPSGLSITAEEIQAELDKRRPGQHRLTTQRQEKDQVEILSGIFEGKTQGTPIGLLVWNGDARTESYENIKNLYRPGHADYTYEAKFGTRDWRGGGRASARETIGRVAAGAIAKKILATIGIRIIGYALQIGSERAETIDESYSAENPLRCPDKSAYDAFVAQIETARQAMDSIGGVIQVVAHGVPAGLGEPVFHKLSADLASAFISIPAAKGFEIGDGFAVSNRRGSENNDAWIMKDEKVGTATNHAGGIVGGISTGEDIVIRCAFKPASSIVKPQMTLNRNKETVPIQVHGRHDPCVVSRAVPVGEAMMALVLVDHYLHSKINRL